MCQHHSDECWGSLSLLLRNMKSAWTTYNSQWLLRFLHFSHAIIHNLFVDHWKQFMILKWLVWTSPLTTSACGEGEVVPYRPLLTSCQCFNPLNPFIQLNILQPVNVSAELWRQNQYLKEKCRFFLQFGPYFWHAIRSFTHPDNYGVIQSCSDVFLDP